MLLEERSMFKYQLAQSSELMAAKAARRSKRNWIQPKLRVPLGLLHVDMRWLLPFAAEEVETISVDPQDQ